MVCYILLLMLTGSIQGMSVGFAHLISEVCREVPCAYLSLLTLGHPSKFEKVIEGI